MEMQLVFSDNFVSSLLNRISNICVLGKIDESIITTGLEMTTHPRIKIGVVIVEQGMAKKATPTK